MDEHRRRPLYSRLAPHTFFSFGFLNPKEKFHIKKVKFFIFKCSEFFSTLCSSRRSSSIRHKEPSCRSVTTAVKANLRPIKAWAWFEFLPTEGIQISQYKMHWSLRLQMYSPDKLYFRFTLSQILLRVFSRDVITTILDDQEFRMILTKRFLT